MMTTNPRFGTDSLPSLPTRLPVRFGAVAVLAFAAGRSLAQEQPLPVRSTFLSWLLFTVVTVAIWFLFYKGLYPLFLHYYRPGFSKFLFWSLFGLYGLAWWHLSLYILFDYGYYYPWLRWMAVFLGALWLIWFVVVMMTRRNA